MEFLKIVRRRSFVSEVVYTALNIALAVGVLVIIRSTDSIWFALGLVALSKWRVLAVRARYWFVNIQANLVDGIVGVSVVIFLYIASVSSVSTTQVLAFQTIVTLLYIAWLLLLKPRSKRSYVIAQAGVAVFVGVAATFMVTYEWPVSAVVLVMWLIGYAAARHVLGSYEEGHMTFLSLLWGLVFAELAWPLYHWAIAYRIPFFPNQLFPQVSIIAVCLSFLAYKSYDSYYHYQKVRVNDILLPLLFTVSLGVALLVIIPVILQIQGINILNL